MSDLMNIASTYFGGLPAANSGEPMIGDSEEFVMRIFPDEVLSQVGESDGSISYFDSRGDLVAIIDDDGNVYVNRGGEILVYEALHDEGLKTAVEDVSGPAKAEGVSGNYDAEVSGADEHYHEGVGYAVPGPDPQIIVANAAKNLFGDVEEFVGGLMGEATDKNKIEEDTDILEVVREFFGGVANEAGAVVDKVVGLVEDAVEYVTDKDSNSPSPSKKTDNKADEKDKNVPVEGEPAEDEPDDEEDYENYYWPEALAVDGDHEEGGGPSVASESIAGGGELSNGANSSGSGGFDKANSSNPNDLGALDPTADLNAGLMMQELRRNGIAEGFPDKTKAATQSSSATDAPQATASNALLGARRFCNPRELDNADMSSVGALAMARDGGIRESSDGVHHEFPQQHFATARRTWGDGPDPFYRMEVQPRHRGYDAVRASMNGLGFIAGIPAGDEESNPNAIADLTKGLGGMACLLANFSGGGSASSFGNVRENDLPVKPMHHHGNSSDHSGDRDGRQGRGDDSGQDGEDDG